MTGPYTFIRNPIYVGNTLMCVGVTVLSRLMWLVPITLVYCVVVYTFVIRYEESRLLLRFGEDYRHFMDRVPRWVPRSLHVRKLGLVNEYLGASLRAEAHCLVMLLPWIMKDVIISWYGR